MQKSNSHRTNNSLLFIKDGLRFLIAGGANTLLTLVIFQIALFFISAPLAYSLSWGVGFLFLLYVYPSKVFPGSTAGKTHYIQIGLIYLCVFILGLGLIELTVNMGIAANIAIFLVMAVTTVTNFLLMRLVLRR